MNDEQKKQIRLFRYQGIGCKKIAETMGLSRDAVRQHCIRHGLKGYAADYEGKQGKEFIKEISHVLCLTCGVDLAPFQGRGRRRKYCSADCKKKWEKDNPKTYKLHC